MNAEGRKEPRENETLWDKCDQDAYSYTYLLQSFWNEWQQNFFKWYDWETVGQIPAAAHEEEASFASYYNFVVLQYVKILVIQNLDRNHTMTAWIP